MTTMIISIDQQLEEQIERYAKQDGVSKNVTVQRLLKRAAFERGWDSLQAFMQPKFLELGIKTE